MARLWEILTRHIHYWGVPNRNNPDGELCMVCYGCGVSRKVKVSL